MATLIGRVGIVDKGTWNSGSTYDTLDTITYNNSIYIAKQSTPAGTLPTNTTYWQLAMDSSSLQPKTMSSPVTIGGESETTVEAAVGALADVKAEKADIASIITTGATNTTGATITKGTYFYLNGSYCKAKTNIANGATFTLNTNFVVVTVGDEISALNSSLSQLKIWRDVVTFEFNASIAASLLLSTITNGIVTSDNIVALLGTPIGTSMTTVQLSASKTNISAIKPSAVTETVTVSLVIWYE